MPMPLCCWKSWFTCRRRQLASFSLMLVNVWPAFCLAHFGPFGPSATRLRTSVFHYQLKQRKTANRNNSLERKRSSRSNNCKSNILWASLARCHCCDCFEPFARFVWPFLFARYEFCQFVALLAVSSSISSSSNSSHCLLAAGTLI